MWFFLLFSNLAFAAEWKTGSLYTGLGQEIALDYVTAVPPGTVVIVSEEHSYEPHHRNQRRFLEEMARTSREISVGMEFFTRPFQAEVDSFLAGVLEEGNFLKAIGWGKNDFSQYREQVLFPISHGGTTLALNASKELTAKVAKVGLSGLSEKEKSELPPNFALGNENYFERFRETMQNHVPAEAIQRYFEAQSIWDDTMAWTAASYMQAHPTQRLVIIVGDFHAAYGGGLPDRLMARGVPVSTVSQVNVQGLSYQEADELIRPDPKWGKRGDYIWVE